MKRGFFIVAELTGPSRDAVLEVQRWADPKLAKDTTPHITLVGSSGVGPIPADTPLDQLRDELTTAAAQTLPLTLQFGRPMRFMQTDIVVLPLDPHGALRALHERIAGRRLRFERARFAFSPHCTLSFFTTLTAAGERRLLRVRVDEPVTIDRVQCYLTVEPVGGRRILDIPLGGAA
ncbi:MAG TPA: 2'-5' RNA ligase family protein [Gemmatimonadaceae bacterium]|nr:2'-5' RNA ligase family protein [Gemmatimonadaceae bacterium]